MNWSWEMFQQLPIEEARQVTNVWLRRAGLVTKTSDNKKELFDICTEARTQAMKRPEFILGRLANRVDALLEELEASRDLVSYTSPILQHLKDFKQELNDVRTKA